MKKTPSVVFIGGKGSGKTTLINCLWKDKTEVVNSAEIKLSEYVDGRGEVNYQAIELPYISFTLMEDIETWLSDTHNKSILSNADVIVFIMEFGDIQYGRKLSIVKDLRDRKIIRKDVSFLICLNQLEFYLEDKGDSFLFNTEICSKILDYCTLCSNFISSLLIDNDSELAVCPYSPLISWRIDIIKKFILNGIIQQHNNIIFKKANPTVVFIGKTGCGKSSTINTICNTNLPVDNAVACTKYPIVINKLVKIDGVEKRINIVDLPGIAESLQADLLYHDFYNKYIKYANVIVCLSQANTRAYAQDEIFFKNLYRTGVLTKKSKIILGINKIDLLFKTNETPQGIDLSTINDDNELIQDKINDFYTNIFSIVFSFVKDLSRHSVIVYSNEQKWNISKLEDRIFKFLK